MAVEEISAVPLNDVPEPIKGKTDIDWAKYQQMYRHLTNITKIVNRYFTRT